jgi:hypothetical protein
MLLLIIIVAPIITALYKRYIPVAGVKQFNDVPVEAEFIQIVDVRDYNQSFRNPIPQAVNLPVAYMNRNWHELYGIRVHVIASTKLEKNMSIRLLKRKGYKVEGFTLTEQQSPPKPNNGKGYCYGI